MKKNLKKLRNEKKKQIKIQIKVQMKKKIMQFVKANRQLLKRNKNNRSLWEKLEEDLKIPWKSLALEWQKMKKKYERLRDFFEENRRFMEAMRFIDDGEFYQYIIEKLMMGNEIQKIFGDPENLDEMFSQDDGD